MKTGEDLPADPSGILAADAPELVRLDRRIAGLVRAGKPHDRLEARRAQLLERSARTLTDRRHAARGSNCPTNCRSPRTRTRSWRCCSRIAYW
ncbi:MAG: hypothetical protein U5R48_06070 [Gammaproteobacteria bacterium]|nr:hypothetical protein [Gammaproteobacteria bacterium]